MSMLAKVALAFGAVFIGLKLWEDSKRLAASKNSDPERGSTVAGGVEVPAQPDRNDDGGSPVVNREPPMPEGVVGWAGEEFAKPA